MPLRFNSVAPASFYDVLEVKIGHPATVRIGSDPSYRLATDLHWLPGQSRSVPCLNEDCPWCHLPARHATFCPIEFYTWSSKTWSRAILQVTPKMNALLDENQDGIVFELTRLERFNGPIGWKNLERYRLNVKFPGFEIEGSLRRMWGEYCNYRKLRLAGDAEGGAA